MSEQCGRDWRAMMPRDFDTAAPDVQLTLTVAPDPVGTPDLFLAVACAGCGAESGEPCRWDCLSTVSDD